MGRVRLDLVGREFGKLKVVSFVGLDARRNSLWLCVCGCGAERVHAGCNLTRGNIVSCGQAGCRRRVADRVEDHPDFHVFTGMLTRCYNAADKGYSRYGGRGIVVCDRWRDGGFRVFIADMGPRPTPEHSIERKDNNGPYSPGNCVWATAKEQGRNRRTNKRLTHNGETHTLSEWAEKLGINYRTLKARVRDGWSVERALDPALREPKITPDVAKEIRQARQAGEGVRAIARRLGLAPSAVSVTARG